MSSNLGNTNKLYSPNEMNIKMLLALNGRVQSALSFSIFFSLCLLASEFSVRMKNKTTAKPCVYLCFTRPARKRASPVCAWRCKVSQFALHYHIEYVSVKINFRRIKFNQLKCKFSFAPTLEWLYCNCGGSIFNSLRYLDTFPSHQAR